MFGPTKRGERLVVEGTLYPASGGHNVRNKKFVVKPEDIELAQIGEEDGERVTEALYLHSGRVIAVQSITKEEV